MIKIRGVVERITFQNPENGFTVIKCAVKDYAELVTVVGNMFDVHIGSVLLLEGDWKLDHRYGQQFVAEKWSETLPATVYGLEKYLGSGLIKGVGPLFAKRIVRHFGADALNIIETAPERLIEVEGIGEKRVAWIAESWEKQKEIKNIMFFLQENDISTSHAARIYAKYGNAAIQIIRENPYQLADDIWGIGFKTADQIASKLGFAKDCFVRCRSGLLYTLSQQADSGSTYTDRSDLIRTASELLEADQSVLSMTLDHMIHSQDVLPGLLTSSAAEMHETDAAYDEIPDSAADDPIYLPPFCYAEIGVANRIRKLLSRPVQVFRPNLDAIEKSTGKRYDDIQKDAIRLAASSAVLIMTGGPGTGKTTATEGMIRAFSQAGLKVLLAAPTGRAAKRMTEATGMEAKTIHRLLEYKPPSGYERNETNPLSGDVLIVDESSMIDLLLMNTLLKAVPDTMRLIMVGDINQLPSIGAGNVLKDLIDSGIVPVIRLTRIFRQAQNSRIITNAHAVNQGRLPKMEPLPHSDFFWIKDTVPEHAASQIVSLVRDRLPGYCGMPPDTIQVLTPMQRGPVGAMTLNKLLQEALRPAAEEGLRRSGVLYRLGDKVMQIRNNYDKEVFNGDIGTVCELSIEDQALTVMFDDRAVPYDISELDELTLAYATTIHKAQGSEFPVVVMPVMMSHFVMLQRNLIYTGITRAKKLLVMIGDPKALGYAVRNVSGRQRKSLLKERLAEEYSV